MHEGIRHIVLVNFVAYLLQATAIIIIIIIIIIIEFG